MGNLSKLDPAIEKVEFKLTVLPSKEPRVQALLRSARVTPTRRKVYFYDTPELDLFKRDLVLRARVTDGDDDDSTVKLRPLPPRKVPPRWTKDGGRIELDVVGKKQVPSAKLDGKPERGTIEQVEEGALKPSKLFSEAQEAVIRRRANGTKLNDLAVLGPVDARKWDLPPAYFPHELSRRGVVAAGRHPLLRALLQGGSRRGREREAGVRRAARLPEDRPQGRPEPQDAEGARVLRRAAALTHLAR